jgi:hypothetical protein
MGFAKRSLQSWVTDTFGERATRDWETVPAGMYSTGIALRWRTVRACKSRMVIAERIEGRLGAGPSRLGVRAIRPNGKQVTK